MTKNTITESKLLKFLKEKECLYHNSNGIEICLWQHTFPYLITCSEALQEDEDENSIRIEVVTEHYHARDFIKDFHLKELEDIEKICVDDLLCIYEGGKSHAFISCFLNNYFPAVQDVTLNFKRWDDKTCIFSKGLNYYDETNEDLFEVESFMQYIDYHHQTLQWFVDKRAVIREQFPQNFTIEEKE